MAERTAAVPLLEVRDLDVYYGRAHALQGVSLRLDGGVLAVVGRNGMGKTTLCNAITGLIPASGSVKLAGEEVLGLPPNRIAERGIGYVPQGRRVWPSLTVDEHLRLVSKSGRRGPWTIARVYETFPRLAERKGHGGGQLSGGEQQMLAIGRALLLNPRLLVMDEPTEGLAPMIVEHVGKMLAALAHEGQVGVLLIEQNLGVAADVSDTVAVMVNGRIARVMSAGELAADTALQQRLLGVRSGGEEEEIEEASTQPSVQPTMVYTVRRASDSELPPADVEPWPAISQTSTSVRSFTRWNASSATDDAQGVAVRLDTSSEPQQAREEGPGERTEDSAQTLLVPVAATSARAAYVVGTFDTKGRELQFLRNCLERLGVRTVTVDLATSGKPSPANVSPAEVARFHPGGARAVFTGDRGSAVVEMAIAFEHFVGTRRDLGGIISAGGSGGTALATQGMRRLAIGTPKMMVSTVASGDVKPYVGPADICMMYAVTDVSGINRISERVLSNAAHALAGMILHMRREAQASTKPAIGLTMFGVTTPCVQAVSKALEEQYDCLTFHATGTGGQSMEKLVDSGLLTAVIDVTTTEVADELVGGVFSAGPQRMEAIIRARVPYVGSCGALDMVNFHAWDTVPERFRNRNLYKHNQNVTLMRTTPQENAAVGEWIAAKLNRMEGPVRFLIPEGGVSLLDMPGKAFWDPAADKALFAAIESKFRPTSSRRLLKLPYNINDPQFAQALVDQFHEITAQPVTTALGR
jgi:uncharacterized protein (UPF0261 family)/ABC-type branched-subunit amino acid transport system ATPase component